VDVSKKQAIGAWMFLIFAFMIAYGLIEWWHLGRYGQLGAFLLLAGAFYYFKRKLMKSGPAPTASAAIVMSAGVFVSDLFKEFPHQIDSIVHLSVIVILLIWLFLISSYTKTIFDKEFYKRHMGSMLNSFGMGTWIAGASVCAMGIIKYLHDWVFVAYLIVTVNSVLWLVFIGLCIRNFYRLAKDRHLLLNGIILLSTVSTESLAIDYSLVFKSDPPTVVFQILIGIGIFFYLVAMVFLVRSYLRTSWNLIHEWPNTNCIIHGALSITGFAGVMTGVINQGVLLYLWMLVLCLFLIVEGFEIARAVLRLRRFGYKKALGTYHYSQWARNFTFSMLLAFTINLPKGGLDAGLSLFMKSFAIALSVVVIVFVLYELILFFRDRIVIIKD
jgi:hypothetical protein